MPACFFIPCRALLNARWLATVCLNLIAPAARAHPLAESVGGVVASSYVARLDARASAGDLRGLAQNEGRKVNHMEVAAEKRRAADPVGEAKRQRELSEMRVEKRKREKEEAAGAGEMEEAGEEEEETNKLLNVTLEQADAMKKKQEKKEKGKAAFGWDVFNQDSLYKAHKKNLAKLKPDLEAYEAAKAEQGDEFYRDHNSLAYGGEGHKPSEEKVEGMVQHLLDAAERRNKFSRRRPEVFEADVDYINDRNKHFNKKVERAFGEYTKVIKENLERGTAI